MKKNIIIVSRAFYPRIAPRAFRATELAKEFSRQGHNVTILTHKLEFDYKEFEDEYNIKVIDFVDGKWKEIKTKNIFFKGIRFILNYLFLYPDIQLMFFLKNKLVNYNNYDLLISIAVPYPVHWGVALGRRKNKKLCNVWIADCGDPFMGNKESKFNHPFYFHFIEKWFCNKPDYLTVPIKEAIIAYPKKCRDKIKVIPQGFNFSLSEYKDLEKSNKSNISFVFAGSLSKGIRDPKEFLDFLLEKIDVKFKFIIYTKNEDLIQPYFKFLGDKIEIRDYVQRDILIEELRKMDFLVNIENTNSVQSPSKLIDYAIVGKPILSIKPNNLNRDHVNEFLNGDYTNKYIIKDIEQYNIVNVANQFIDLL